MISLEAFSAEYNLDFVGQMTVHGSKAVIFDKRYPHTVKSRITSLSKCLASIKAHFDTRNSLVKIQVVFEVTLDL